MLDGLGQELGQDQVARGVEQRLLDRALQLADIARPGIRFEQGQGGGVEAAQVAAPARGRTGTGSSGPVRPRRRGAAQGRHGNRHHVEAVIEVLAEAPLFDQLRQVVVGRRQDADPCADLLVAAEALETLLLQDAEDFGLKRRGHVADFIEEEGPAVGLLELADALPLGPGEGALFVAEQLAFQQVLRDGGAVDGQEGLIGTAAVLVQGAGDQLLARPAFAQDEHVDILRRHPADGLAHLLHHGAAADDAVSSVVLRQHRGRLHQARRVEGPAQEGARAARGRAA